GFIVRTNGEGRGETEFGADVEFLSRLWAQVRNRYESVKGPAVLHEEGDLTFRVVRDLLSPEVDEFLVDSREVYDKCLGYVEALVEDTARTNVLEISELGLVEMTRKRVRQDLRSLLTVRCPTCAGSGVTKSEVTVAGEIFRAIRVQRTEAEGREIVLRAHPDVVGYLEGDARDALTRLAATLDIKITVNATGPQSPREEYQLQVR